MQQFSDAFPLLGIFFLKKYKNILTNAAEEHIICLVYFRRAIKTAVEIFRRHFIMVFEKIKEILAEQLDADPEEMTMDTKIAEDLEADSLDVVELLMSIEDEFEVEIPDEEIENLKTIGDVVEYIQNNMP